MIFAVVVLLATLLRVPVVRSAVTQQFLVYRNSAFANVSNAGYFQTVTTHSEGLCAEWCAISNNGINTTCTAAQYDISTGLCYLATNCAVVKLVANTGMVTYAFGK